MQKKQIISSEACLELLSQSVKGTPYEGRLFLVGGAVRDQLLGLNKVSDLDIASEVKLGDLLKLLQKLGVLDRSPEIHGRFGTAMVMMEGHKIELAAMRQESYSHLSRKPNVGPATIEDDARRRDFTVNALYRRIDSPEVLDVTGLGIEDLKANVLRTPVDPSQTFFDDPLRMLRAVRFRWKLGFNIEAETEAAIVEQAHRLEILSAERIRDELELMLGGSAGPDALQDLLRLGLLDRFWPELALMKGVEQGSCHHLDVWDHTLLVIQNLWEMKVDGHDFLPDFDLVLAALFHDVGKPQTKSIDPQGEVRFLNHEGLGADITFECLQRLRFSEDRSNRVAKLVKAHMRLGQFDKFGDSGIRRLIRDMGDELDDLLNLIEADSRALHPSMKPLPMEQIRVRIATVRAASPVHLLKSPLSGNEIAALLEIEPSPLIGEYKKFLTEEILEGRLLPGDHNEAIRLLKEIHRVNSDRSRKN